MTPWTAAHQAFLSFTISWSFLKLISIESVMPSNHLILCHPFLLLPSIFLSIRVISNETRVGGLISQGGEWNIEWMEKETQGLVKPSLLLAPRLFHRDTQVPRLWTFGDILPCLYPNALPFISPNAFALMSSFQSRPR